MIDSSAWIAYLTKNKLGEIIDNETRLFLSSLSLFEIKKKLMKDKISEKEIFDKIDFIKKKSIILPVTDKIAEMAAEISIEKEIPSIDSIIYATALENNLSLITLDNDFRGLPNAVILD
ncbi:MAG: hypothetical protein A2463_05000 [Candidatus Staskawiczbacteria bacterium RIFOXYC2_FULL_32_10]|nr:MAG: hypothetical protein A2463_05000 [Candidatus Staskawiczbacteria bacterium RIFOXYC2_FULL_32_10]